MEADSAQEDKAAAFLINFPAVASSVSSAVRGLEEEEFSLAWQGAATAALWPALLAIHRYCHTDIPPSWPFTGSGGRGAGGGLVGAGGEWRASSAGPLTLPVLRGPGSRYKEGLAPGIRKAWIQVLGGPGSRY